MRALSEVLGAGLPYNSLDDVRRRLADVAPHFGRRDALEAPLWLNGEYFKVGGALHYCSAVRWPRGAGGWVAGHEDGGGAGKQRNSGGIDIVPPSPPFILCLHPALLLTLPLLSSFPACRPLPSAPRRRQWAPSPWPPALPSSTRQMPSAAHQRSWQSVCARGRRRCPAPMLPRPATS